MLNSHLYFTIASNTVLNVTGEYVLQVVNKDNSVFQATIETKSSNITIKSTTQNSVVLNIEEQEVDFIVKIQDNFNHTDSVKLNSGKAKTYFNFSSRSPQQYVDYQSGSFTLFYAIKGLADNEITVSAPELIEYKEGDKILFDNGETFVKTLIANTDEVYLTKLTVYTDIVSDRGREIFNGSLPVEEIPQRFLISGAQYGSIQFIKPIQPGELPVSVPIYYNMLEETSFISASVNSVMKAITIRYAKNELNRVKITPIHITCGQFSYDFELIQAPNPNAVYLEYDTDFLDPVLEHKVYEKAIYLNTNSGNTISLINYNFNPAVLRNYYNGNITYDQTSGGLFITYSYDQLHIGDIRNFEFEQPIQANVSLTTKYGTEYSYPVDLTIAAAKKAYVINDTINIDRTLNITGGLQIKPNVISSITPTVLVSWLSASSFVWNNDTNTVELISVLPNNTNVTRQTTVQIQFNRQDLDPIYGEVTVIQESGIISDCKKAFEDIFVIPAEGDKTIEVYTDTKTLFEGSFIDKMNLHDFTNQLFVTKPRIFENSYLDLNLTKYIYTDSEETVSEHVITYDYSYDNENHLNITEIAQPIDYYDPRQYIFESIYMFHNIQTFSDIKLNDRTYSNLQQYHKYNITLDAYSNENMQFTYKVGNAQFYGTTFKRKCTNANYAVYYMNSYGGWNWMLFEGNKQIKKYNNTFSSIVNLEGESEIYKVETISQYDLTSLILTDSGSKKLSHLYKSPIVYLHDFSNDELIEVKVDTKTYSEKTYVNSGNKYFTQNIVLTEIKNKFSY